MSEIKMNISEIFKMTQQRKEIMDRLKVHEDYWIGKRVLFESYDESYHEYIHGTVKEVEICNDDYIVLMILADNRNYADGKTIQRCINATRLQKLNEVIELTSVDKTTLETQKDQNTIKIDVFQSLILAYKN